MVAVTDAATQGTTTKCIQRENWMYSNQLRLSIHESRDLATAHAISQDLTICTVTLHHCLAKSPPRHCCHSGSTSWHVVAKGSGYSKTSTKQQLIYFQNKQQFVTQLQTTSWQSHTYTGAMNPSSNPYPVFPRHFQKLTKKSRRTRTLASKKAYTDMWSPLATDLKLHTKTTRERIWPTIRRTHNNHKLYITVKASRPSGHFARGIPIRRT